MLLAIEAIMGLTIEQIKKPIAVELEKFNQVFDEALITENELLSAVHQHIHSKKGKQLRPTLTLLAADICNKVNSNTIKTALAIEMLHTASLVHDDIVDESSVRRGQQTVNANWNDHIAVLVGDYLLSQALNIAIGTQNLKVLEIITELGKKLSEGELQQIENVQRNRVDENKYLEVIKKKTAVMFEVCTTGGALTVGANEEQIEKLKTYGNYYGICFQIRDDIFDYISNEKNIGKPVGNDLKEGKLTLPIIYALNQATEAEKNVINQIRINKDYTKENIEDMISFTKRKGGIEYAQQKIEEFSQLAIQQLDIFKDSDTKDSLINLVKLSSIRNY